MPTFFVVGTLSQTQTSQLQDISELRTDLTTTIPDLVRQLVNKEGISEMPGKLKNLFPATIIVSGKG